MSLCDSLALYNLLKESFRFIAFPFEYIVFPTATKYMFHWTLCNYSLILCIRLIQKWM